MIVPGDPNEGGNVVQMLPKWAQPTMADFLQAAAIMDQKGKFQVAGEVLPFTGEKRDARKMTTDEYNKMYTNRLLTRSLGGGAKVLPIKPEDKGD